MTQDEIIRMAREANDYANKVCRQDAIPREWRLVRDVCFAVLVAAHERETCAKVCESFTGKHRARVFNDELNKCAAAIRSRK